MKSNVFESIALLTTGDEVVSGDISNRNATKIANELDSHRFCVKTHLAVRDDKETVVEALLWLMTSHKVIITTGGLGPTLDDLTIDAISEATQLPIEFNEHAWEMVQSIYEKYGISCTDNNKRLARFVRGARLLSPVNGTAHGSIIETVEHIMIALPGPPNECMPMIERDVIPFLKRAKLDCGLYRTTFYLFAASESHVANLVEPLCLEHNLEFGFRTSFPYLEVKVFTKEPNPNLHFILDAVKPWYIGSNVMRYEEVFLNYYLKHFNMFKFTVNDECSDFLNWLPGWSCQHGQNEITVSYNHNTRSIQTSFNGQQKSFVINKNYSGERMFLVIKAWLSMQWLTWLQLS